MRTSVVCSLMLCLVAVFALAQGDQKPAADHAAQAWLSTIDSGSYDASWTNASTYLKRSVTKDRWSGMMNAHRQPLGALVSRKLSSADQTTTLPGAPDGEYVVLRYDTSFTNKKTAVETVTMMLDDGTWRAAGYFIK